VSMTDAIAALSDLADGRKPDWIRLAMGVTALRARSGEETEGCSVFTQAVALLKASPEVFADDADLERLSQMRATAVTLRQRLTLVGKPVAEPTDQVEAAWRMVDLQAQRVISALDADAWARIIAPDFHFLIVSMRRLRRSVAMLVSQSTRDAELNAALGRFDAAVPFLSRLPDIGERLDSSSSHRSPSELSVHLPAFSGARKRIVRWSAWIIDIDAAVRACSELRQGVAEVFV